MSTKSHPSPSIYRWIVSSLTLLLIFSLSVCTPPPSPTAIPTPTDTPTLTPTNNTPTIEPVTSPPPNPQYIVDINCPSPGQALPVVEQKASWRYTLSGTIFPNQRSMDSLSLNVVYKRVGTKTTDWTFVWGNGTKPNDDGHFQVDGYIGNTKYPPEEGDQVLITVVLLDKDQAPRLDGKTYQTLADISPSLNALSLITAYKITLAQSVSSCLLPGYVPQRDYSLAISCPTSHNHISVDKLRDTWRYAITGAVAPVPAAKDLSVNVIYKRGGENPTEWVFTNSGGAKPHPNGDFWVDGYIGEPAYPPLPGETFAVVLALTNQDTAENLDNYQRSSPYVFDNVKGFSYPFYVTIGERGEAEYSCRDLPQDPTSPARGTQNIRITCPANDNSLTVNKAGDSWNYLITSQVEPDDIPPGATLFLAYRRFGDAQIWEYDSRNDRQRNGTDWVLLGKRPGIRINNTNGMAQYQIEGWIGDSQYPPVAGEQLILAVLLMDSATGNSQNQQTFRTLDKIPAQAYSYPVYIHIRQANEPETQCQIKNGPTSSIIPIPESKPLDEPMGRFDAFTWEKADGWSNGLPFQVGWRADHTEFMNGVMRLRLDDQPCVANRAACSNQSYASSEYRSKDVYSYGCYQTRFKAASGAGLISSFFTFFATSERNYQDNDEIDIEILGKDPTQMQVNYFQQSSEDEHKTMIPLGFNASQDFHEYAFEWSQNTIKWFVDGKLVHTEDGSKGTLPMQPGQIMMNLWTGTGEDFNKWAGQFAYPGSPIYAEYDWVRYTPEVCPYPTNP